MRDAVGYTLSGCNPQALDLIERARHEYRCFTGDPLATADAALAAAPELVMARVLRAWLLLLSTEAPAAALAEPALASARGQPHDERESLHLQAIELLSKGQWHAAGRVLEALSALYPLDALALQVGQQIDFFCGDTRMLRDRILAVLPAWSDAVPGWHAVLGMLAFGLEENGDYARAERLGRQAVELEPRDAWAQHAVAHVLEMQGRRDEGIRWMEDNPGWRQDNFLAVHNWWHLALHHLARGDSAAALKLYDGPIHGHRPAVVAELIDASALLWRAELLGHAVGDRWVGLAERWAPHAGTGTTPSTTCTPRWPSRAATAPTHCASCTWRTSGPCPATTTTPPSRATSELRPCGASWRSRRMTSAGRSNCCTRSGPGRAGSAAVTRSAT